LLKRILVIDDKKEEADTQKGLAMTGGALLRGDRLDGLTGHAVRRCAAYFI
jgi:hypothetical protein